MRPRPIVDHALVPRPFYCNEMFSEELFAINFLTNLAILLQRGTIKDATKHFARSCWINLDIYGLFLQVAGSVSVGFAGYVMVEDMKFKGLTGNQVFLSFV